MRLSRRWLLCGLSALLAASCLSPTLPLPPPAPPETIEPIGQGQYRLEGVIPFSGTVLVLDQRTALVYGKVVDDVYSIDIAAEPGDDMTLWYQSGQDVSDITVFQIPADDGSPSGPPPADASDGGAPRAPDGGGAADASAD